MMVSDLTGLITGCYSLQDSGWQCFGVCSAEMYTQPELSPTALRATWSNFTRCGNPCGCTAAAAAAVADAAADAATTKEGAVAASAQS